MLVVNEQVKIPLSELSFTYVKSSGPGGQKVNKTNSRAVLRWNLRQSRGLSQSVKARVESKLQSRLTEDGEIVLQSDRFRDRGKNTADCLEKLRRLLTAAVHVPKKRVATKPTRSSIKKRQESKKLQSEKKRSRQKVKI